MSNKPCCRGITTSGCSQLGCFSQSAESHFCNFRGPVPAPPEPETSVKAEGLLPVKFLSSLVLALVQPQPPQGERKVKKRKTLLACAVQLDPD